MADDDDIQDILEEMRALAAEFRETTILTQEETAAERAEASEERDDREKERRSGEHGRDWQTLQQRIDMGTTTEQDITTGVDLSSEANAVRKELGRNLSLGRAIFASTLEDEAGEFEKVREAQAELARTVERLRELNRIL